MSILEMQVEALMRLCTAGDEATKNQAREEIRYLLQPEYKQFLQAGMQALNLC